MAPFILIIAGVALAGGWSMLGRYASEAAAAALPPVLGDWRYGLLFGGLLVGAGLIWRLIRARKTGPGDIEGLDEFLVELLHRRGYDFPPEAVGDRGAFLAYHPGGCSLIDLRAVDARRVGAHAVRRLIRDLRRQPQAQSAVLLARGAVTDAARSLARNDRVALVKVQALRESLSRPPAPAVAPAPIAPPSRPPAYPWAQVEREAGGTEPGIALDEFTLSRDELRSVLNRPVESPPRLPLDGVESRLRVHTTAPPQFARRRDRREPPPDWDALLQELEGDAAPAPQERPRRGQAAARRDDSDPWGDGR